MKIFYISIAILLVWFGYQKSQESQFDENRLTVAAFKEAIKSKNIQLIDVRTSAEYKNGHILDAFNFDVLSKKTFLERIDKLDKNQPTYIYCRSGKRSLKALKIMKLKGFKNVYDLKDGYLGWKRNN